MPTTRAKHATGKHRAPRTTLRETLARIIRPQPTQTPPQPMEAETVLLPRIIT